MRQFDFVARIVLEMYSMHLLFSFDRDSRSRTCTFEPDYVFTTPSQPIVCSFGLHCNAVLSTNEIYSWSVLRCCSISQ